MNKYSAYLLTALRMVVGWHFLYEGINKLIIPGWSARMYLMESKWIFADVFHQVATSSEISPVK